VTGQAAPLVRPADAADRGRMTEIMNATWRAAWAPHLPADADLLWHERDVAGVFIGQTWAFCLVADVDGGVAGFAHLAADEVTSLHVDPSRLRRGIGRALMAAAEHHVRALGFRRLRIEAELFNTPAHAFYAALGYTETRRFDGDVIGTVVPCIEMVKTLD
jgi:GNAT superfamily N-acetyltransferase